MVNANNVTNDIRNLSNPAKVEGMLSVYKLRYVTIANQ